MAFKNIMIPEENMKDYEVDGEIKRPRFCTIDEDRKIMLFGCDAVFEEPRKKNFALIWEEKVIKALLCYKIEDKNTIIWELEALYLPKELEVRREDIKRDLREAMQKYGCDGDSGYLLLKDEKYLDKTKTIINF